MDQEKQARIREEQLTRICEELRGHSIAAQMASEEESEIPGGVLTALFDTMGMNAGEVIGEIFFLPDEAEDAEVQYYQISLLMADGLKKKGRAELLKCINWLNTHLPLGRFVVDEEREMLLLRLGCAIPIEIPDDMLYELMQAALGNAVSIADRHLDPLLKIAEAEAGIEALKELYPNM